MNLLSAEKISKSYSEKILFENISLGISEGEKIGVIGINGTGKSTLLKVIAGEEKPDSGRILIGNGVTIGYLPQNPVFEAGTTVLEHIFKGNSPVVRLVREYEELLQKLESGVQHKQEGFDENNHKLNARLLSLTHQMDTMNAWTFESEVKTILTKLGITDFQADVGTLSGGQKKRIAMAGALINPVDLLILDEPTNHIDNFTVEWLEKYLNNRKGALLMVTHDRYFLDRVANRTIELDKGRLFSYEANYSKFLEMKAEREELEQASERKRQSLFRRELEWIRRGAQARSTKQKARIDRFEKLQEGGLAGGQANVEIVAGASRLGRKVIELEHVSKSLEGKKLVCDLSYTLLRDDRIGIIGPNGIGKSTLLKLISGILQPDSGNIDIGETVKIGYFSQEGLEMNESLRVIEYIREEAEFIMTGDGPLSASQMLELFLFPPNMQWTPISKLSGGERRRLFLLRVLMGAPNVLLLDEPTNDLDIQTLTILEGYIDEFPGAVIAVSHDRYFLDRIAESIFSFEGDGEIKMQAGNYSDYIENASNSGKADSTGSETVRDKGVRNGSSTEGTGSKSKAVYGADDSDENNRQDTKKERPMKFTFKEQKEFEQIDDIIAGLEQKIKDLDSQINEHASNFAMLPGLLSQKETVEKQLDEAIERWTYLNELAEEIERRKKQG